MPAKPSQTETKQRIRFSLRTTSPAPSLSKMPASPSHSCKKRNPITSLTDTAEKYQDTLETGLPYPAIP